MSIRILIVDDERQISGLTREYLEAKGLEVHLEHSGDAGLRTFREGDYSLCVLDIKMPIKDGFTLAREIRELDGRIPIIFLTGQTDKEHRIEGFNLGADDYLTKPFSMEELYLRIRAILRRSGKLEEGHKANQEYKLGKYGFHPHTRELELNGETTRLTGIESRLLEAFCEAADGMLEREAALRRIWDDDHFLRGRSLNVYVSKLRQHLSSDDRIEILNVHGLGYRLVVRD